MTRLAAAGPFRPFERAAWYGGVTDTLGHSLDGHRNSFAAPNAQ